jgi:hypothetical protein
VSRSGIRRPTSRMSNGSTLPRSRLSLVARSKSLAGETTIRLSWCPSMKGGYDYVLWAGLVGGRFEGMDEDGNSEEHLVFQVWGTPPSPPTVIRWWSKWVLPPLSDMSSDGRRQVEGLEAVLDQLSKLRTMTDPMTFRHSGPMPGGGETSFVHAVLFDPVSETWWVDGTDIRRTLREVTEEEAQNLMSRDAAH